MRTTASEVNITPKEIAKLCSTGNQDLTGSEGKCVVPEEELDEDAVPDVVSVLLPVLLLVCDVEEILDEDSGGSSRTSKLNHIKSILSRFPKDDEKLTRTYQ